MQQILAPYGITLRLPEGEFDVEETGSTFAENAYIKAAAGMRLTGLPTIADDSGLVVDALNGEPGIYSARYGGAACKTDEDRWRLLLQKLEHTTQRSARFVCTVCCVFPDGRIIRAEGRCEGEIALAPQGTEGFGYDPVFYIPSERKTFAQLSQQRKNELSHRGAALADFRRKIEKEIDYADK